MKRVSVIIPVYNNPKGLDTLLQSLVNQSYPRKYFEIIVVDNGSEDGTVDVARKYERDYEGQMRVLVETSARGSYAARNAGIRQAEGEIIALIDSDCVPIREWIENGVASLELQQADLIGGNVEFVFSPHASSAEMYDALTHMQMRRAIETQGTSPTANLFAHRAVFDQIGLFLPALKSGGDTLWTRKATDAGLKLKYAADAQVLHPARGLRELLKKNYRVAGGHLSIWQMKGIGKAQALKNVLRYFFPPRPQLIEDLINERGTAEMKERLWSIWLVAWMCRYATNLGRIGTYLHDNQGDADQ